MSLHAILRDKKELPKIDLRLHFWICQSPTHAHNNQILCDSYTGGWRIWKIRYYLAPRKFSQIQESVMRMHRCVWILFSSQGCLATVECISSIGRWECESTTAGTKGRKMIVCCLFACTYHAFRCPWGSFMRSMNAKGGSVYITVCVSMSVHSWKTTQKVVFPELIKSIPFSTSFHPFISPAIDLPFFLLLLLHP